MAQEDPNLKLVEKEAESAYKTDTIIEIIPIDDFEVYEALAEYRPNDKQEVVLIMQKWFAKAIFYKRARLNMLPPKEYEDEDMEFQRSYRSKWFAQTMRYFAKNFKEREKCNQTHLNDEALQKAIKNLIEGKKKDNEKHHKRKARKYPSYSYNPETR